MIVTGYPDNTFRPEQPFDRREVAPLIHQVLVSQGKTAPIADQPAAQYMVGR